MGAVFKAIDRRDESVVAVKLLHEHLVDEEDYRERFEREAHVAALLRSPYTVHLLDYGVADGRYFLVMEYVDGLSLRAKMNKEGPIEVGEALRIATKVARALEESEARSVVHRDVKPDNILVANDGTVKLSDFGIARQLGSGAVTMPGAFVGTLVYAAPEIAHGEVDHRSDIYSLGATLYDALTGRPPFLGTSLEVLRHHADSPVPDEPLRGLPSVVIDVIMRTLEKQPDNRYQSPAELASALTNAAEVATERADAAAETQIARGPIETAQEEVAATEVMHAPPSAPSGPQIHLRLGEPKAGFFATRFGSVRYDLSVVNAGDKPATVALRGETPQALAVVTMPRSVTVPARSTVKVPVRVRPRNRRATGPKEPIAFTISADAGEGQPPSTVPGNFEDVPFDRRPIFAVLGAGLAAAVALVAILILGGGSQEPVSLTADDLAAMMLQPDDLRPAFSNFREDSRLSGPQSNESLVSGACDPGEVGLQVQEEGRLIGYESVYRPSQVSSLALEIRSRVDQYETPSGALEALSSYVDTQLAGSGELACAGVSPAGQSEFTVSDLGDEARGIEITNANVSSEPQTGVRATVQGSEVVTTAIAFVLWDLVGKVEVDGDPAGDYQGITENLARKLEARMIAGLGGPVSTSPSPTAKPSASPSGSGTPSATTTPGPTPSPPRGETATPTVVATVAPTAQPTPQPTTKPTNPPPATNAPAPVINSINCPSFAEVNETVTCNASVSSDTETSLAWSASSGTPTEGTGPSFSTSFTTTGTVFVGFAACNQGGCSSESVSIEVAAPLATPGGDYVISIDSVFSVAQDSFVTVDLYVEAPDGLGFWDIDVVFDNGLLTPWSCSASTGECDAFFFDNTMNFSGAPFFTFSSDLPMLLGSLTFLTNFTPGTADLFIEVFGLEDADGNEVFNYNTLDGLIVIQ